MQQSSATPKTKDVGIGLLHALNPPCSAFLYLQFWHGVIPTSHFIFKDFYTCFTNFFMQAYSTRTYAHAYCVRELL